MFSNWPPTLSVFAIYSGWFASGSVSLYQFSLCAAVRGQSVCSCVPICLVCGRFSFSVVYYVLCSVVLLCLLYFLGPMSGLRISAWVEGGA